MRIFKVRYRSGEEFINHYDPEMGGGGIFYPTRENLPPGEQVVVDLRFSGMVNRELLRGQIAWRRPGKYREKIRAGIGIEFKETDRSKIDHILAVAKGDAQDQVVARRHRRLPVEWGVEMRVKETLTRFPATLDDISAGGAFLRTSEAVADGTMVVLELTPPGAAAPLSIEGKVAWAKTTPGQEGIGVEFRCRDTGGLRRLKELVRRLELAEANVEA